MMLDNQKLKEKLESKINRPSSIHELKNAEKDALLLAELLIDVVNGLESRVEALEKRDKK